MAGCFWQGAVGGFFCCRFIGWSLFGQRRKNGVGDFISGRNMVGLPESTAVTGALFIALLVISRSARSPLLPDEGPPCAIARHVAWGRAWRCTAVESRSVMAAGMMRRESVGRKTIRGASGRRSKRRRRRPTHTRPSTRASRENTWQQALACPHSERPDRGNRTRTRPAPGWRPLWSRSD